MSTSDDFVLRPEDEYFHDRSQWEGWDDATSRGWFNESGLFDFSVREHDLSGFFYVHHRANRGILWAGTALWDPSGATEIDCLWHDFTIHPLPAGQEVWDFELETQGSRIRSQCEVPLKTYNIGYEAAGAQLNLTWTASIEPVMMPFPKEWQEWGPRHYDFFGRMTGEIFVEGHRYEVDCFSMHDRSFGPHTMTTTGRGTFAWGVASEQEAFIAHVLSTHPAETDPVFDTVDAVKGGWYMRDGKIGKFVGGERRCERASDSRPLREVIHAKDEHGREIEIIGETRNHLMFTGFPEIPWWWSLVSWTIDGRGAYGETQDTCGTMPNTRRIIRSLKADRPFALGRIT